MSDVTSKKAPERPREARGKLKIGDDWNAITIIALSQSNPLKAIAELVENSIDAKARIVTITRGREHGRHYLSIRDDGVGGADPAQGSGLVGLRDRIEAVGGELEVTSPAGHGTTLLIKIPAGSPPNPGSPER